MWGVEGGNLENTESWLDRGSWVFSDFKNVSESNLH